MMSQDELAAIIKARNKRDTSDNQRSWEQTRRICFYTIAAMQGTKVFKKPEDVFGLVWDKKSKKLKKSKPMTKDEVYAKAMAARAYREKRVNKKGK